MRGWSAAGSMLLSLSVLLQGCASTGTLSQAAIRPVLLYSDPTEPAGYMPGLRAALCGPLGSVTRLLPAPPSGCSFREPVRVLTVHGMRVKEVNYSEELQEAIAEQLGLGFPSVDLITIGRGYDPEIQFAGESVLGEPGDAMLEPSTILKRSWHDNLTKEVRLVFYELLWAPTRDLAKRRLLQCYEMPASRLTGDCAPDEHILLNLLSRSAANRSIKEDFLIGGFADGTIALGGVGEVLHDDLALTLCVIAADVLGFGSSVDPSGQTRACDAGRMVGTRSALEGTPFFTVAYSLGGFFLTDGLRRLLAVDEALRDGTTPSGFSGLPRAEVREEFGRLFGYFLVNNSTTYLFANQVSLLNLARLEAVCRVPDGSSCPNPRLATVGNSTDRATQADIIAFNEPDDLLGYELPQYYSAAQLYGNVINISVRNPGFAIPGLFRSPGVHTSHGANPAVINAVVEGFYVPQ